MTFMACTSQHLCLLLLGQALGAAASSAKAAANASVQAAANASAQELKLAQGRTFAGNFTKRSPSATVSDYWWTVRETPDDPCNSASEILSADLCKLVGQYLADKYQVRFRFNDVNEADGLSRCSVIQKQTRWEFYYNVHSQSRMRRLRNEEGKALSSERKAVCGAETYQERLWCTGSTCSSVSQRVIASRPEGVDLEISRGLTGYDNDERATFIVKGPGHVQGSIDTEDEYDSLEFVLGNTRSSSFSGRKSFSLAVPAGIAMVTWSSDDSIREMGWEMTFQAGQSSPDLEFAGGIIVTLFPCILICWCLYCCCCSSGQPQNQSSMEARLPQPQQPLTELNPYSAQQPPAAFSMQPMGAPPQYGMGNFGAPPQYGMASQPPPQTFDPQQGNFGAPPQTFDPSFNVGAPQYGAPQQAYGFNFNPGAPQVGMPQQFGAFQAAGAPASQGAQGNFGAPMYYGGGAMPAPTAPELPTEFQNAMKTQMPGSDMQYM